MRTLALAAFLLLTADGRLWSGESGGYAIDWSTSDLRAASAATGASAFTAAGRAQLDWEQLRRGMDPNIGCDVQRRYRLVSAVGELLGVEETQYFSCTGTAHPSLERHLRTYPLSRNGAVAEVTSLFGEREVFEALSADPLVRKALREEHRAPSSLAELEAALAGRSFKVGRCPFVLRKDWRADFVLHHAEGQRAAVRVALFPDMTVCQGKIADLGLLLPVPPALRPAFEAAAVRRSGVLPIGSEKALPDAQTMLDFSNRPDAGAP